MKKALLITFLISTTGIGFSQVKGGIISKNITDEIKDVKKKEGTNIISTVNGIKLFAVVKKGKIQKFAAANLAGKDLNVISRMTSVYCEVCVSGDGGSKVCWEIPCSEMPRPKDNPTR